MNEDQKSSNIRRVKKVTKNFFLHIHAAKVHPHALKPAYTFGLGLILGFLFLIMIATGLILMLHYTPSVEQAYNSVKDISFIVPGGRIIRNIHRWAAHGMVLVAFLHLMRVFYTGSYLESRTTNWIIGVSMLIVVMFMSFSGYLLPWDQLAYWAVTIGSNIAASARELTDILGITASVDIGGFFKRLLIGDEVVGQSALTRFFMLHVVFLPLSLLVLTGVHFWRIRKDGGLTRPAEGEVAGQTAPDTAGKKWYSWPVLMWAELATLLFVAAVVLIMAFLVDAPLTEQANPSFPDNPAKSPWYFLGIQELVSYSAFSGGMLIPLLFITFLISIPYIDKEGRYAGIWFSGAKGMRIMLQSAGLTIFVTVSLTGISVSLGWFRDWFSDFPQLITMIINPATVSVLFYAGWAWMVRRKSGSSRLSAIALFTCAMTAFIIYTSIGIWFRGPNWDFYWSSSQWPVV